MGKRKFCFCLNPKKKVKERFSDKRKMKIKDLLNFASRIGKNFRKRGDSLSEIEPSRSFLTKPKSLPLSKNISPRPVAKSFFLAGEENFLEIGNG